jgi:hypothetical protein
MATEPIQILDGIVRGVVFACYDFARLTFVGFVIPFVSKRPRFWPKAIAASKRLSSMTYLVLWILLTLAIGIGNGHQLMAEAFGLSKAPNVTLPAAIVVALITVLIIDMVLRASFSLIHNTIKRQVYTTLARIGLANVYFGACIMMPILGGSMFLPPLFSLIDGLPIRNPFGNNPELIYIPYPRWFLFLFSFSLAVVVLKAFSIRGQGKRLAIGLSIVLAAPVLVVGATILAVWVTFLADISLFPVSPAAKVVQTYTQCTFKPDRLNIVTFLKVANATSLPVKTQNFIVSYESSSGQSFRGRVEGGSVDFILLSANYTRVELVATYELKPDEPLPTEAVECTLEFVSTPFSADVEIKVRPDEPANTDD